MIIFNETLINMTLTINKKKMNEIDLITNFFPLNTEPIDYFIKI